MQGANCLFYFRDVPTIQEPDTSSQNYESGLIFLVKTCSSFQLSFGSTTPTLSKKTTYPLFFRTIPSQVACNSARIAVLKKFNWKRVGLIGKSDTDNSEVRWVTGQLCCQGSLCSRRRCCCCCFHYQGGKRNFEDAGAHEGTHQRLLSRLSPGLFSRPSH